MLINFRQNCENFIHFLLYTHKYECSPVQHIFVESSDSCTRAHETQPKQ